MVTPLRLFVAAVAAQMIATLVAWSFNTYVSLENPMPAEVSFIIGASAVMVVGYISRRAEYDGTAET